MYTVRVNFYAQNHLENQGLLDYSNQYYFDITGIYLEAIYVTISGITQDKSFYTPI